MCLACRETAFWGQNFFDKLQDESVWYIVDSVEPLPVQAKTVVSASFNSAAHKVSNSTIRSFAWHILD